MIERHIATVELYLDFGPQFRVSLRQASEHFVIADTTANIPPCEAKLVMVIDGKTIERAVRLPDGLKPGEHRTTICDV